MDTNVKEFKYSMPKKVICVLLAFITFMVSAGLITACIGAYAYCDGEIIENYTDSRTFRNKMVNYETGFMQIATQNLSKETFRGKLEKNREAAVDKGYQEFAKFYSDVVEGNDPHGEEKYEQIWEQGGYYDDYHFNIDADNDGETDLHFIYADAYGDTGEESEVKANLDDLFSIYVDQRVEEQNSESYQGVYYGSGLYKAPDSLKYHILYDGYEESNIDEFNEDEVYKHDVYVALKDGKVTSNGFSDLYKNDVENCLDGYPEDTQAYFYMDFPYENLEDGNKNLISYARLYDEFQGIKDFHDIAMKIMNHLTGYIVLAVLLLIVSFAAAFVYFIVAGRKDDENPAKLAFIDYVPVGIHSGVYAALITGAVLILDDLFYSQVLIGLFFTVVFAALIWLMVFEFCASIARSIKSDRKFYKFFLTYWVLKLLYIIAKGCIKLDVKIFKALVKSIKRTNASVKKTFSVLTYKPAKFKRNVIALSILYVLGNLIAALITALFYDWYYNSGNGTAFFFSFVFTVADIGINVHIFIKVLKYIKQLDKLIETASNHEHVNIDTAALPQSLKYLAEGINFTTSEMQAAVAKAVKDERLKTELITNVSHDLKTPLTSIINYVDLLQKCDIQDEKAKEYIKVLDDKGAKLKRLIEDLLEASKVNSGNITINPTKLNLYELCLQATVESQADFEKAGLELVVKENNEPPVIFADGPKAFRVFENLISNARKYSAKASRVYVSVYNEGGMGVFEIKNVSAQPLDISPEELTERFVRGDKSRSQEGNGLGLSIAKELCKAQGGNLELVIDGDLFKAKAKLPLA